MTILLLLGSESFSAIGESIAHPASRARTYVQGSAVKIWVDVLNSDTSEPILDLTDITALIAQPDGTIDARPASDIETDDNKPGRYSCLVDTALPGAWIFQFTVNGDTLVVAKARFHVREAILAPTP